MVKKRVKYCVIGTGAGGGMLAYRLAMAGVDVTVLNSGTLPTENDFQNELSPEQKGHFEIYRDTSFPVKPKIDLKHPLLETSDPKDEFQGMQCYHVNGLQNLWNGISLRYSEDDFGNRNSYNKECEWPITYDDLAQHYSEVELLANVVGNYDRQPQFPDGSFQPPGPIRAPDRIFMAGNKKLFGADFFSFANRKAVDLRSDSPQQCVACGSCARGCRSGSIYKFSTHLLPKISARSNFQLLQHMRVIRIVRGKSISEVIAINEKNGQPITIQADIVIVCTGAIETPRILLNSLASMKIESGQIGQFLQDSPRAVLGSSLFRLWFKPITESRGYGDHVLFGGRIKSPEFHFPFVAQFWSDFAKVPYYLADLQFAPRFLKEMLARQIFKSTVALIFYSPAVPRRENQVMLADETDGFAQRRARIQYNMANEEIENSLTLKALGRKMLFNASGYFSEVLPSLPGSGVHYVGTCRMGRNRDKGVVDKDLQLFGAPNVYICDGSVIPVLSEKHPTLTIMALAHRLADHLLRRYG